MSADRRGAVAGTVPMAVEGEDSRAARDVSKPARPRGEPRSPRTGLDAVLIVASSLILTGVFLYLLQLWDVIHFTGRARAVGEVPNYLYYHLRSSIFFFTADLLFFVFSLRALSRHLDRFLTAPAMRTDVGAAAHAERESRLASIYSLDARSDMAITTFFGIGVIYTAIGMESALLTALGGISGAEDAARQGAWEILRKLVDGGLILALSTTICGGIGGYALRLWKHAAVGRRLTLLGVVQDGEVESLLGEIRDMLRERTPPSRDELDERDERDELDAK